MRYCGRFFSEEDIRTIREIIAEEPKRSRVQISRSVCKSLSWYKLDGGLKEMSCRVALLRMERDELIKLPPPLHHNFNRQPYIHHTTATDPQTPIFISVDALPKLRLSLVVKRHDSHLWNEYIDRYHYLGYKPLAGAQLRYMAKSDERIIALFGFGAAAWKIAPRDRFIGWTDKQRAKNLHLVVNNARFLILPWIRSKNLASKLLAMIVKRLPYDWQERYNYKPVLLETFVESYRFHGTCYKAANWIYVGQTQGRGKFDVKHLANLPKKDIWLYPLNKTFRDLLYS